jgi:hypothetical protein
VSAADVEFWLDGGVRLRKNLFRTQQASDTAALATGVMTSVALYLEAGDVVTNLTVISGATAAGTPLNYWLALYDTSATPALVGQTADQTTTAWAADTAKTLALVTPYTVQTTGIYYVGVMVKATTPPTLMGVTLGRAAAAGAVATGQKVLARTSGSTLTTTAPATIASPTTVTTVPLVIAS